MLDCAIDGELERTEISEEKYSALENSMKPVSYTHLCMVVGAIINTILDPIFIFVCDWGIAGGAWATVIGQIFSFILAPVSYTHLDVYKRQPRCYGPWLRQPRPP